MATKTKADDEVARGADVPLALAAAGPRDALIDPQPGDIIPDLEEKGYHVGEVRQPAEPVLHRGGDVTFESLGDTGESKFTGTGASLKELKAAHNAREASDPAYEGVLHTPDADPYAEAPVLTAPARDRARTESTASARTESTAKDLDADAAKVAKAQAAEDKS